MVAVHYKDLAGNPRSVMPVQPYTRTSKEWASGFLEITYTPAALEFGSMGEVIGYAMSVVASKPEFIDASSVPWLLAYMDHIRDLFEKGVFCERDNSWRVQEKVKAQVFRNFDTDFIYVTRFTGALDVLKILVFGIHYISYSDESRGFFIVESFCQEESPFARLAAEMAGVFDLKDVKRNVTSSFCRGFYVSFEVPEGEQLIISGPGIGKRAYGAGTRVVGAIERFHKTQYHWTQRRFYVAFAGDESPENPAFTRITHAVTPCELSLAEDDDIGLGTLMQDACFYLPHTWITGIVKNAVWEPELVPVTNHA